MEDGMESTFRWFPETLLFLVWYLQALASGMFRVKAKQTADKMQIDNSAASRGCRFEDCHGLVHKQLAGESITVDTCALRDYQRYLKDMSHGIYTMRIRQASSISVSWKEHWH
jgi:hypothetical protein